MSYRKYRLGLRVVLLGATVQPRLYMYVDKRIFGDRRQQTIANAENTNTSIVAYGGSQPDVVVFSHICCRLLVFVTAMLE